MENRFADKLAAFKTDTRESLDDFITKMKVKEIIEENEEKNRLYKTIGIIVAAVAVIGLAVYAGYLIYRMIKPDYIEDYDDDFDYDDFDEDEVEDALSAAAEAADDGE
ncbi:MAG TPA: hypothetical protein IAB10_03515 [Candidatus Avilachnospira avistercoris]|nr:hypothetical protein [Candidatus Avilachnospira avistercoris]